MERSLHRVTALPLINPIGWDFNPSSLPARMPIFAASLCGAFITYILFHDFPNAENWILQTWSWIFLSTAVLSLCGGNRRWAKAPWLVSIMVFIAAACLIHAASVVVRMALMGEDSWLTWIAAILAIFCLGPGVDEWLASGQHVRLQSQRGRSPLRVFFGFSDRIRPRSPVICDPLFGKE
jgi:peptidoglycan/LPS O-acetylase OafA/YrhL